MAKSKYCPCRGPKFSSYHLCGAVRLCAPSMYMRSWGSFWSPQASALMCAQAFPPRYIHTYMCMYVYIYIYPNSCPWSDASDVLGSVLAQGPEHQKAALVPALASCCFVFLLLLYSLNEIPCLETV